MQTETQIEFLGSDTPTFEIVLAQRDFMGNPTDKKIAYSSNSAVDIWSFFERSTQKLRNNKKDNKTVE